VLCRRFIAGVGSLGADQLAQLAKNSFAASFIPEADRDKAYEEIEEVVAAWKSEQQQRQQQQQ
jgi:adenosine deaminase